MLQALFSALRGRVRKKSPLDLLREKRRTPRRSSARQLVVLARGQAFPARCIDESDGGVRFECSPRETLRRGDRLELSTTQSGRVAWVRKLHGRQHVGVEREGVAEPSGERREFIRLAVPVPATCRGQRLEVLDVSLRGLKVRSEQPLTSSELPLELHLPGLPLLVRARVQENSGCTARLSLPYLDPASEHRLATFLVGCLNSPS